MMTDYDFDLIIIESFKQKYKQIFFEDERNNFKCVPSKYASGLMESFTRLKAETNLEDRTRCVITKPNGDVLNAKIRSDEVEVGYADEDETDEDNETAWSKEVAFYGSMGKVSFPFKNDIHINRPEFSGTLTAEMMENLWPDLQLYLQSIIDDAKNEINADVNNKLLDDFTKIIDETGNGTKIKKPFFDYLLHAKSEILANELKAKFSTERGKGIRFMIEALKMNDPILLSIGDRQKKEFYKALKTFFNRNIGTYQGIFDFTLDENYILKDLQPAKTKIEFILKSIN